MRTNLNKNGALFHDKQCDWENQRTAASCVAVLFSNVLFRRGGMVVSRFSALSWRSMPVCRTFIYLTALSFKTHPTKYVNAGG